MKISPAQVRALLALAGKPKGLSYGSRHSPGSTSTFCALEERGLVTIDQIFNRERGTSDLRVFLTSEGRQVVMQLNAAPPAENPSDITYKISSGGTRGFTVEAYDSERAIYGQAGHVGTLALGTDDDFGEKYFFVTGLHVNETHQRMGIATELYRRAVIEARKRGRAILSAEHYRSPKAHALHASMKSKLKHERKRVADHEVDIYANPPHQDLGIANAVVVARSRNGKAEILRWVLRFSYPRNGNVDRPTPEYVWSIVMGGRVVGGYNRFRKAKEDLEGFANGTLA